MSKIVVLAGGVGGAKLIWGLAQLLPPADLTLVGNTGDDFRHLGLLICPDLDTVMYTLAGLVNPVTGWGLQDDGFQALNMAARYGAPDWFKLGDRDLGTHLARSELLAGGKSLTEVTRSLCHSLGVDYPLLPMSDSAAPTMIESDQGLLAFQDWFVRLRWQPAVRRVVLPDPPPSASAAVLAALEAADLIVIAPSNPMVSVAPILNMTGVVERMVGRPVVAVSPIIGGRAVKGPAAKMMAELGMEISSLGVARYYGSRLLGGLLLDEQDAALLPAIEALGMRAALAATWMRTDQDRIRLAEHVLAWGLSGA